MRWLRATIVRHPLLASLVIVALGLLVVDNVQVTVWDGHFPLQVHLLGTQNLQIVEVASEPLSRKEYAAYVRTASNKLDLNPERVDWIEGQPFTVQVPCSGRSSTFGRELNYSQFQLLVLRIAFGDGKVAFIPIEIPDGRVSRQVTVSIPERQRGA